MSLEIFEVTLNTGNIVVKDHYIMGAYVFPAAGFIEMALENLEDAESANCLQVKNIVISKPLIFEHGKDKTAIIEYKSTDNNKYFYISSHGDDGETIRHIEGRIGFDAGDIKNEVLDFEAIKARCTGTTSAQWYYSSLGDAGLQYGSFYRTLENVYYNHEEAAAELCKQISDSDVRYILDPSILDGVFQSVGIFSFEENSKYMYLPYYIEKISINSALPEQCLCFGSKRPDSGKDSPVKRYDIKICGLNGQVLAVIEGLCLKSIPAGHKNTGSLVPEKKGIIAKDKDALEYVKPDILENDEKVLHENTFQNEQINTPKKNMSEGTEKVTFSKSILQKKLSDIFINEIYGTIGFDTDEIDVDLEFGEMGFDSIFAEKVISHFNDILGIEMDVSILFDYTTIWMFSSFIAENYNDKCQSYFSKGLYQGESGADTLAAAVENKDTDGSDAIFQNKEHNECEQEPDNSLDIAITGIAGRFPGAENVEKFWDNLSRGICSIKEVPKERWDMDEYYDSDPDAPGKTHCRYGAFLNDIDKFDPAFFGISINKAALLDPQQRLMLETVWHAVEDAGYGNNCLSGTKTGVYIGVCNNEYIHRSKQGLSKINPHIAAGNTFSAIANRISHCLNVRGPSIAIDTACSSSLAALYYAYKDLLTGECDFAIVGGVNLTLSPVTHMIFGKAKVLSPDGKCGAFDDRSNGYVRGEGVGAVILRRLDKAAAERDNIYAVIKSAAVGHAGLTNGLNTPSALSEKELVFEAYQKAGIDMESISYIEAHGTGTSLGDTIEMRGLSDAFKEQTKKRSFCAVGSVKNNIGHLEAASGMAGIIKVICALKERKLPPNINFNTPSKKINFLSSSFYVNDRLILWEGMRYPLRAGVSSFGFGGTNAHVVLEEAPVSCCSSLSYGGKIPILVISAKNKKSLSGMVRSMMNYISTNDCERLEDICYTSAVGRGHYANRISIIGYSLDNVEDKLKQFIDDTGAKEGIDVGMDIRKSPSFVFVFEDLELDQYFDASGFYTGDTVFRDVIDECLTYVPGEIMEQIKNYYKGIEKKQALNKEIGQLIGLLDSYAMARTFMEYGIRPAAVSGCGIGIQSALIAGIVSIQDVVDAKLRGKSAVKARSPLIPYIKVKDEEFCISDTYEGASFDILGRLGNQIQQLLEWCEKKKYDTVRISSIKTVNDFISFISKMYCLGADIDWRKYYRGQLLKRLSLPKYIFKRNSYWID